MQEKGLNEENSQDFAKVLWGLRYYDNFRKQHEHIQATSQPLLQEGKPTNGQAKALSEGQIKSTLMQLQAYRLLSASKALPEGLQKTVLEGVKETAAEDAASHQLKQQLVQSIVKQEERQRVQEKEDLNSQHLFLNRKLAYSELFQRSIMTSISPVTLDPIVLRQDRQKALEARADLRIQQLESVPSGIAIDSDAKLRTLIELKSLRLMEKQRQVRADIMQSLSKATTLTTAIDRTAFRRIKKQTLREARQTEKHERHQRSEREKRERQKHSDFLASLNAHFREFGNVHRGVVSKQQRLGASIGRFHANAQKEEERRLQRVSEERLNALKANDEEAYLKLIDQTKDTRITHLLNQTNSFLNTLMNAVEKQKSSVGADFDVGAETTAAEDGDDDDGTRDYYATAHKIKEVVTEQPSILVGGTLKEYQIKGLQWMVSLYNNRLNGILADEMGLGKTIQTLSLITYLVEKKKQPGPFLVIVPLSTMTNWVLEFEKWAPAITKVVYKGSPNERKQLGSVVKAGNFNVLLTTFEYIINPKDRPVLSKVKWVHMIIDEGHRMKNANSRLSTTLMQYYSARYRLILTGTPLQVIISCLLKLHISIECNVCNDEAFFDSHLILFF